jgi:hypothetical protein
MDLKEMECEGVDWILLAEYGRLIGFFEHDNEATDR